MLSDLTSVSTFGWYTESSVDNELLPISTFGWYFDILDDVGIDIDTNFLYFLFCITRQQGFDFIR